MCLVSHSPCLAYNGVQAVFCTPQSTVDSELLTHSHNSFKMVKVLAILYDGGKAAQEEPKLLGTVENKVGHGMYSGPQLLS